MSDDHIAPARVAVAPLGGAHPPAVDLTSGVRHWFLLLAVATMAVPTFISVARESWSTEQGAHGPIVLATGIWLLMSQRAEMAATSRPGNIGLALLLLLPALALYIVARLTGTLEVEGPALYLAMIAVVYAYCGMRMLRLIWFPIVYLAFLFPPPDTLVATLTQPLKLGISKAAVDLLAAIGYPIARNGVIIQIDQYDILVAAACAGLNSIISLSAIGLFYIYVRHNANWRYALLLMCAIIPVAVIANFVRVLLLILITYYFGDALAQGFLHGLAGIVLFGVALGLIFALDALVSPLRRRLSRGVEQ